LKKAAAHLAGFSALTICKFLSTTKQQAVAEIDFTPTA
jgi:hypothetical protein